ncbi:MAG: hypothetical protein DRQ43_00015 [Gammaproteobacteria bacterium]|nr:MAG: hypothetical protein DRQ43_00015 [Gammaproteobacteria bacterium]
MHSLKLQKGFSIVELMVGLTIGLLVVAGASAIWVSSKVSYGVQADLSEIQETGRFSISLFQQEMRQAGFMGCANSVEKDKLFDNTSYSDDDFDEIFRGPRVEGEEGASGASDSFTMRGFKIEGDSIGVDDDESTVTDGISIKAIRLKLENQPEFKADQFLAITDCSLSVIFEVKTDMEPDDLIVELKSELNADIAEKEALLASMDTTIIDPDKDKYRTHLFSFYQNRYFISGNSLMRTSLDSTEEILPDVENMQVLYGIDTDGSPGPDEYLAASAMANNWDSVVSIKVGLIARSSEEFGMDVGPTSYSLLGQDITVDSDRRRRKEFTTEVSIRNWQ